MNTHSVCRQCQAFQKAGLDLLSESNKTCLDTEKKSHHYRKNEIIFSQGELVGHVFCLRTGLVKLDTVGDNGHEMVVGFVGGGDLLGVGSVLSKAPSNVAATAIEETHGCSFSAEFIRRIFSETPSLALFYLNDIFKDLRMTQQRLLNGVDKDVKARVAEALVYLKANYPDHNFTRKEIAEWAGTTTESVIRTLSQFENDGIIEQVGRQIKISDQNKLFDYARILF